MRQAIHDIRPSADLDRLKKYETFRTPDYSYKPLFDYQPDWFQGSGFDPSAGDGRMLAEIVARGNPGPHYLNDIREEELPFMQQVGIASVGDYLEATMLPAVDFMVTNPPFSKTQAFIERAKEHVSGPICILQSLAFQGSQSRASWFKTSGLAHVLILARRPRWETDFGRTAPNNVWDNAWYVFLPDYDGLPQMDWLT